MRFWRHLWTYRRHSGNYHLLNILTALSALRGPSSSLPSWVRRWRDNSRTVGNISPLPAPASAPLVIQVTSPHAQKVLLLRVEKFLLPRPQFPGRSTEDSDAQQRHTIRTRHHNPRHTPRRLLILQPARQSSRPDTRPTCAHSPSRHRQNRLLAHVQRSP